MLPQRLRQERNGTFTLFQARYPAGTLKDVDGTRVAVLVIPALSRSDCKQTHSYAGMLQSAIARLAAEKTDEWICGPPRNLGGNMWPMVEGLGPLLGFVPSAAH